MAITYPIPPESRWAVLRRSTGEIIARNAEWPRTDGGPYEGLDPDFVYLRHVNDTPPDYDSRYYSLRSTEVVDVDANELRRTFDVVKRPTPEILVAAENEEARRLRGLIRLEREAIETRLMVGAILNYIVDAQQFPPKVRAAAADYIAKALQVWKNRDRLAALRADIEAGLEPDLDAGWEGAPPEGE